MEFQNTSTSGLKRCAGFLILVLFSMMASAQDQGTFNQFNDQATALATTAPGWNQIAKLTASDGIANEWFSNGLSVTADGSIMVVGAPAISNGSSPGSAYVFVKSSSGWTQAKLTASDGAAGDLFGYSVAISSDGSTIAVGAYSATALTTRNSLPESQYDGAVYVFVKPTAGWSGNLHETAKLTLSDIPTNEGWSFLGGSVAVSADGSTVVGGADSAPSGTDGSGETIYGGAAYVFVKPSGGWVTTGSVTSVTETAKLTSLDTAYNDDLGISTGISNDGSTIVVGADQTTYVCDDNSCPGNGPGAAYVFVKPTAGWGSATETAKLTASAGMNSDYFGYSVAVSADGSTIVIGAYENTATQPYDGAVYVFVKPTNGWLDAAEDAKLFASDSHNGDVLHLGTSVAVSANGSTVMAGAPNARNDSTNGAWGQGAAYVFSKPTNGWVAAPETAKLIASDRTDAYDHLGESVALKADGLTAFVGAPEWPNGANQGGVYIYAQQVQFNPFNVTSLAISTGTRGTFTVKGSFTLGTGTDGINLASEAVTLQLGTFSITIPAASFKTNRKGSYVFTGTVNSVALDAQLVSQGSNSYAFQFKGTGANLSGTSNPVTVKLTINNDAGGASVTGRVH